MTIACPLSTVAPVPTNSSAPVISTVSNSIGVEAVSPPRVTSVLLVFETAAVPEAITVPLRFTTAVPLAAKSPVVRLTVELK